MQAANLSASVDVPPHPGGEQQDGQNVERCDDDAERRAELFPS